MNQKKHSFRATEQDRHLRLDQLLAAHIASLSRRKARVLIDLGGVYVDGKRVKVASRKLSTGQQVEAFLGEALASTSGDVGRAAREQVSATLPKAHIIHEDEHILVADKPTGLAVAPTRESDRMDLIAQLGRPGLHLVHRLDVDASGVVVIAKTAEASRILSGQFREHTAGRTYLAFVAGAFPDQLERIEAPIANRSAVTHVSVTERFGDRATLIQCKLETGRTHQIRIHCQGVGHPVLGDREHGHRTDFDPPRLALHATKLELRHPSGQEMTFESPLPDELKSLISS